MLLKYFENGPITPTILTYLVLFQGGIYLFQLADWYSSAFALLVGAGLEVTSISLIYGMFLLFIHRYLVTWLTGLTMQMPYQTIMYLFILAQPFSHTTNFGLFKTERVFKNNFIFNENGTKFSKRVENIVGKGEIARYEQFLLFAQCFQKTCTGNGSNSLKHSSSNRT